MHFFGLKIRCFSGRMFEERTSYRLCRSQSQLGFSNATIASVTILLLVSGKISTVPSVLKIFLACVSLLKPQCFSVKIFKRDKLIKSNASQYKFYQNVTRLEAVPLLTTTKHLYDPHSLISEALEVLTVIFLIKSGVASRGRGE